MKINIKTLKLVLPLNTAWFWVGIWLLFYLRVTDYAGIGLLEATMFFIGFVIEIPTGALSDMIGKKPTLAMAFLFYGLGNLVMGLSDTYSQLFISVFLMVIGSALYSGTAEALLFDSLKTEGEENRYGMILARIETYGLLVMAIASAVGGFVYAIDIHLPFILTALAGFLGFIGIVFFIKEPPIDTEKFSFRNYLSQNKQGVKQLLHKVNPYVLIMLVAVIGLVEVLDNLLDIAFAIQLGFDERSLGILFAALPLIGASGAYLFSKYKERFPQVRLFAVLGLSYFAGVLLSPYIGILIGTFFIGMRSFIQPIFNIIASDSINQSVVSKYRATALSTFAILRKLPYVLMAYFIGSLVDTNGASNVMQVLGLGFLVVFMVASLLFSGNAKTAT
ncbi:MAG: MFS transporter [Candidatus Dojkabacteria bacterium]